MINNTTFTHIFRTYKPITTYSQRCQYEIDFQSESPEYIELRKNVYAVAVEFLELGKSWRRTERGSDSFFVRSIYIIRIYWQLSLANLYVIKYIFEIKEKFVFLEVLFCTILTYIASILLLFQYFPVFQQQ